MVIELIILVTCFFLFLFTLYTLSKEDFVFLRKNITIEEIFNVAFLTAFLTLFFSRLFFVIFHFKMTFLNPLVFFLIPYFPGLTLLGGVLGGVLSLLVIAKRKKYPRGRLLDFFSYAFLSVLPLGYAGYLLTGIQGPIIIALLPIIYYAVLFIFFMRILLPRFLKGQMKDGMMGLLILMNYSLFTFAVMLIKAVMNRSNLLQPEIVLLLLMFITSVALYVRLGVGSPLKRS